MEQNHSIRKLNVLLGLVVVTAVAVMAWPFAEKLIIPARARLLLSMTDLAWEHWAYRNNFDAYVTWRWRWMIAVGYPSAFTGAVACGAVVLGAVVALFRRQWQPMAQPVVAASLGGIIGWALMMWAPLPNELCRGLAMPALAFLGAVLAPALLTPATMAKPVRGTVIRPFKANTLRAVQNALGKGRVVLAGAALKATDEIRHVAAIGATGSGKSVALLALMFTALRRGDRHVVADPDGSAMRLFYREGDVILNPADARSAKWDMLAEIEEHTDYRLLAEAVVPFSEDNRGSDWVMYAREIFTACLETWHQNQLGNSDAFFHAMATADREKLAQLCEGTAAHRYFESGNEKMLGGVMGTLAPALGIMSQLGRVQGEAFSIRRWVREGQGCLWMPYRAKQIPALRGLISCWMGLAISETLSLPESRTRRIWFHVDELDALGRIQGLKDALARLRKVGGCAVLGLQSIAQARAVYGEAEAHTIIENCHNKLILNCGASEHGGTAHFASQVIGDREVERIDTTTSRGAGPNGTVSTSRAVRRQREPAVMDSEIMQLDPCTGYLKVASRSAWLQLGFKPLDYPAQVEAFMPAEPPMRDAAE